MYKYIISTENNIQMNTTPSLFNNIIITVFIILNKSVDFQYQLKSKTSNGLININYILYKTLYNNYGLKKNSIKFRPHQKL